MIHRPGAEEAQDRDKRKKGLPSGNRCEDADQSQE